MSNLLKSKFFLGALVVAVMLVGAVAVKATPASADCSTGTTTLKVGSKGDAVKCLQAGVGATADGNFGPMTKAKVMAWQASVGLKADGVFGPMSRAKFTGGSMSGNFPAGCSSASGYSTTTGLPCNTSSTLPAGCTSTAGYSPTTGAKCDGGSTASGPLAGGAGSVDTITKLSTYNNETINEGDTGSVLAVEVKADAGSDLNLSSVKLTFDHSGAGSYHLDRYADEVSVWVGGKKVGSAKGSDFTKNSDNTYTKNINLSGAVVKAGQKLTVTVGVTANTTIDSVDQDSGNANWNVNVDSVRYNDATGAILTETTSLNEDFGFSSIANSGDLELKLTEATTNPEAGVVEVSDSSDTDNVPMLSFKLQAQGGDMDITQLEFTAVSSGDTDGTNEIVSDWTLFKGSTEIASYDTTASTADDASNQNGTVVFSDINDLTLAKDSTTTFTVKAKIKEIGTGSGAAAAFDQGDSVTLSFDGSANLDDTTNTVIEDSNGDTIVAGDRSGSVAGNAQSFYSEGIVVALVSKSATKTVSSDPATATDSGTYVINFDVTAIGADMYIDKSSVAETTAGTADTTAGQGVEYYVSKNGTAGNAAATKQTAPSSILSADGSTTGDTATAFKVNEGETRHFHLTVNFALDYSGADASGFYRVNLGSINWDNESGDTTPDFFYTFNLGDYQTADLSLDDYSL